jgi:hypothetical protein
VLIATISISIYDHKIAFSVRPCARFISVLEYFNPSWNFNKIIKEFCWTVIENKLVITSGMEI